MPVSQSDMTSRERLNAAIAGKPVDRPPVSLWQHLPERDQTAADLADATLTWHQQFPTDFVKFMPPGDYPTIDWGAESVYQGSRAGTRTTVKFPMSSVSDWTHLPSVSAREGFNHTILDALARTRARLADEVPLFHTVFSPLTIAMKLSDGNVIEHLRSHPAEVHAGLAVIRDVTRDVAAASLEAGGDGFFFATQCADYTVMDEVEYLEFGLRYDLEVLENLPERTIVMLHLHGASPMFQLESRYPAHIINWHDQRAAPSLADGQRRSGRCVAGGINEQAIVTDRPGLIIETVKAAVAEVGGRSVVIAPGCVIPIDTPPETIKAILAAFASDLE